MQLRVALKGATVAVKVSTIACQHLLAVRADKGRGMVFAARFGQIHGIDAHIAQRHVLILKVVSSERCHGRQLLVLAVVRHVHITAQHAAQFGHIGQYCRELAQVHLVHTHCQVVHRVLWLAIYFKARAVVGQQVHVGPYAVVLAKEYVVILVHLKVAVSQHRIFGIKVNVQSAVNQSRLQSHVHTAFALAVVVTQFDARPRAHDIRPHAHFERVRVLFAVLHQTAHLHAGRVLEYVRVDGVEQQCAHIQRPHACIARHAHMRVGVKVDVSRRERVALHAGNVVERIVASGVKVKGHDGQVRFKSFLVNVISLRLLLQFVGKACQVRAKVRYVALGPKAQPQVAGRNVGSGCVAACGQVKQYVLGHGTHALCGKVVVGNAAAQRVGRKSLVGSGLDVDVGTKIQRVGRHPKLFQVNVRQRSLHRHLVVVSAEQRLNVAIALQQRIVGLKVRHRLASAQIGFDTDAPKWIVLIA